MIGERSTDINARQEKTDRRGGVREQLGTRELGGPLPPRCPAGISSRSGGPKGVLVHPAHRVHSRPADPRCLGLAPAAGLPLLALHPHLPLKTPAHLKEKGRGRPGQALSPPGGDSGQGGARGPRRDLPGPAAPALGVLSAGDEGPSCPWPVLMEAPVSKAVPFLPPIHRGANPGSRAGLGQDRPTQCFIS